VGRHNTFGHPAPETIDGWSSIGAEVLRTDYCGAISLANGTATTVLRCTAPSRTALVPRHWPKTSGVRLVHRHDGSARGEPEAAV
jgi:beta-lactamase superfamily II metal-dependent hydrolase